MIPVQTDAVPSLVADLTGVPLNEIAAGDLRAAVAVALPAPRPPAALFSSSI